MKCPDCQGQNPETSKFCHHCGARLILICPECNAGNPPDSRYCDQCGCNLATTSVSLPPAWYSASPGRQNHILDRSSPYKIRYFRLSRAKFYILFITFYLMLSSFLFLEIYFSESRVSKLASISKTPFVDSLILGIFLISLSLFSFWLADFSFRKALSFRWFKPRLGNILVYEGYITRTQLKDVLLEQNLRMGEILVAEGHLNEEQLERALSEQRNKLGEILIGSGRITIKKLNQALDSQREVYKKLGEILIELGHSTDQDIDWALGRKERRLGKILHELGYTTEEQISRVLNFMKRKLGEILQQNGFITNYELHTAMLLQQRGQRAR